MKKKILSYAFWVIPVMTSVALIAASPQTKNKANESDSNFANWRNRPHESFADASKSFELVKQTLLKNYVDKGLTEEDLYRAAVQGMLTEIDPEMSDWNKLMTPAEYSELSSDLRGQVVGVGVEISFDQDNGYADVLGVFPGTPAAKAGVSRGDKIVKIDNKTFKGKQLRDVVYAMRGKPGSEIKLSVLHEAQIKNISLKRESLAWDSVQANDMGDGIALLSVRYFNDNTPGHLRKSLDSIKSKKLKGLIVDLRGNEGGAFDRAVDSIRQLVPKGKPIVTVVKRGGIEEKIASTADPVLQDMPLVVLMNSDTKSGAEVMAAALKMSAGAITVGKNTFGKWSMQKVDELPNKFAMKYTIATFLAPDGSNLNGKGLKPDIAVELDEAITRKLQNQMNFNLRLEEDIQLQSAFNVLKMKS